MNYDTLFSLGEKYFADKTEAGMQKSKMFFEYLANTGTNAAAMVIKDFVMNNKFHNQLETAKHLSRVPFSIRRPNKKLVVEYEKLLNWPGKNYYDYEKSMILFIIYNVSYRSPRICQDGNSFDVWSFSENDMYKSWKNWKP